MKTNKQFILVNSQFSAYEAKEVLESLYLSKINFHQMKNFSSVERFGLEDELSKKRIPELKESLNMVIEIVNEAMKKNMELKITSTIHIDFLDHQGEE